jgi:phage tail tape-measure protein
MSSISTLTGVTYGKHNIMSGDCNHLRIRSTPILSALCNVRSGGGSFTTRTIANGGNTHTGTSLRSNESAPWI